MTWRSDVFTGTMSFISISLFIDSFFFVNQHDASQYDYKPEQLYACNLFPAQPATDIVAARQGGVR